MSVISNTQECVERLNKLRNITTPVVFDIETTGLKPHNSGHKIYSFSFCSDNLEPFSFLYTSSLECTLKRLFLSSTPFIIHNSSFEYTWVKVCLGVEIKCIYWDTMLAEHILYNQNKVGLKKLVQKYFKVEEYDLAIKKYLRAPGGNGINDIHNAPIDLLLEYNNKDTYYTYKLYNLQKDKINNASLQGPLEFFLLGNKVLSDISMDGFKINKRNCVQLIEQCNKEVDKTLIKLKSLREYKLWARLYGNKLNLNSSVQLRDLLYEHLKYPVTKKTAKDFPSTDQEALRAINSRFVRCLLQLRKYQKAATTYLENILKETSEEDKLHCNYNLGSVSSFRGSSSNPNLQNIPLRDPEIGPMIRRCFIPHPNQELVEVDYSNLEVRIGCCYHKDPKMIDYINNPNSDMHRDSACDCFIVRPEEVSPELRQITKGDFVFAQQYGSYYELCAPKLWKAAQSCTLANGTPVLNHLANKGIMTLKQFTRHIKKVEYIFWHNKFLRFGIWRDNQLSSYEKHKTLWSLTGFKYSGYIKRNQCFNLPIQGTAFHVLLKGLVLIHQYLRTNGYKTKIVNQIHDSIIFSMEPSEKEELLPIIQDIMVNKVKHNWDWLTLPLDIEIKSYGINNAWVT